MKTRVKTASEIVDMRRSGAILAGVLSYLMAVIKPGMSTIELDDIAVAKTIKAGAKPAFHGYQGFPANICISINDEIVHAIPGERIIRSGDVVGLDYGVNFNGMITDSAVTVLAGAEPSEETKRLLEGTNRALNRAIDQVKPGVRVGDIGAVIEAELRKSNLSIAEGLSGHGVGHELHEDPSIPNFGTFGSGQALKAGMTIAIEPIATLGRGQIYLAEDGWTYKTVDGSLSAQFEHTVLITERGVEVLTAR